MLSLRRIGAVTRKGRLQSGQSAPIAKRIAAIHTTRVAMGEKKDGEAHTTDSYAKDVDVTPATDSKVHRVDPNSDSVQKPYEPPSGYSRSGVLHEEYHHTQKKDQPYAPEGGEDSSYGAKNNWTREHSAETSSKEDGPEGNSSRGRK